MKQRLRVLAEAGAVLASSLDWEQTLASVASLLVPTLADWCTVHVLEEDGAIRQLAVAHADPSKVRWAWEISERYPLDMESPRGVPRVILTGESELYEEIPEGLLVQAARDADHLRLLREVGLASAMVVPMRARGRTLGALSLFATESGRRFDPDDLALAEELGGRAATALDNARLYRQLQDSDRRKDRFLAMLAHELRNPLSAISNALQVLRQSHSDERQAERALDIIERQVHHQVRLVDDLLDVTRIVQDRMELAFQPLDLVCLVRHTAEDHRRVVEDFGQRLELELADVEVPVRADPTRLAQVLGNLLHNAAKFTDPGGLITVRVEEDPDRGRVGVHVQDTGVGIPPELLPLVFDTFAQAEQSLERSQGGLGLGLALVRGLVELHGGTVEVRSTPGEGSCFSFWLPRLEDGLPAAAAEAAPEVPSRRILLVEDNEGVAESLRDLLELMGHEVEVACDGAEALDQAFRRPPDLVLCDLGLPVLDGYEVARRLRADPATRDLLLVALTGYGQEDDRRRSAEAGFDVHLTKPLRLPDLESLLQRPGRGQSASGTGSASSGSRTE